MFDGFAVKKKSALRFTKKSEVLENTHEIAMEAIQPQPSRVAHQCILTY